jgi:hypothetical protein
MDLPLPFILGALLLPGIPLLLMLIQAKRGKYDD